MLLHDEIYVQESEEYVGGVSYVSDANGLLYKGVVCFMTIGLKSNVPYIIQSVPETEIRRNWLKEETSELLMCLVTTSEAVASYETFFYYWA